MQKSEHFKGILHLISKLTSVFNFCTPCMYRGRVREHEALRVLDRRAGSQSTLKSHPIGGALASSLPVLVTEGDIVTNFAGQC